MKLKGSVFMSGVVFLMACFLGCQPEKAPPPSLWTEGAWAIYSQNQISTDGKAFTGKLKVSCVGSEMIDGTPYYWLELRKDKADGGVTITKFLAKEKKNFSIKNSFVFWDDVKQIIIQEDSKTPEKIPPQYLSRFAPTFVESVKAKRFGNVKDIKPEKISDLPPKSFSIDGKNIQCTGKKFHRKFVSSVNLGFLNLEDTSEISTEYYASNDVPFGGIVYAKYVSTTQTVNKAKKSGEPKPPVHFENTLQLERFGATGAKSQIIGTPVEKKIMPFPFLNKK